MGVVGIADSQRRDREHRRYPERGPCPQTRCIELLTMAGAPLVDAPNLARTGQLRNRPAAHVDGIIVEPDTVDAKHRWLDAPAIGWEVFHLRLEFGCIPSV